MHLGVMLLVVDMGRHASPKKPTCSTPGSRHARPAPPRWLDPSKETCELPLPTGNSISAAESHAELQSLLWSASDQQQQAEATSSTLREMVQTLVRAQQLLRGPISLWPDDETGLDSNRQPMQVPALQLELAATQSRLVRALSALEKLQLEHKRQKEAIHILEQQFQQPPSAATAAPAPAGPLGLFSGIAAVMAGAANKQLQQQQQELANKLAAQQHVERKLREELEARQRELQDIDKQVCASSLCSCLIHLGSGGSVDAAPITLLHVQR